MAMRCAGGGRAASRAALAISRGGGRAQNRVQVAMRGDEGGDAIQQCVEILDFLGLNEAEVALRQIDVGGSRQRAENGDPKRFDRLARQPLMTRAGDAIEDRAGDADARIIGRAALDDGRRRLRLAADVDAEQDRPAEHGGDVGRGAGSPGRGEDPVEKPHRALAEDEIAWAAVRRLAGGGRERAQQLRRHRPAVEIDARPAGRGGVKSGIDIVRPAFGGADAKAARLKARIRPSVSNVLPLPERGAAMTRPGGEVIRRPRESGADNPHRKARCRENRAPPGPCRPGSAPCAPSARARASRRWFRASRARSSRPASEAR